MPMKTNEREYRDMSMVVREMPGEESENNEMIVEGYASTFNKPYTLYRDEYVEIREVIDKDAFNETDMSDVIMQYNHEGRVFARISNNTLTVNPDERGLFISADLGGTEIGRGLYEEIKGGYTDKMSFGFTVPADGDTWDETKDDNGFIYTTRTINKVGKLYDVSAVSIPANDATSISVRDLSTGVVEKIQAERLEAEKLELERKRTETRARAITRGSK